MDTHQKELREDADWRVYVMRLNHRRERDKRITTHCALVGRAFGALGMYYSGDQDEGLETAIKNVRINWGGAFSVQHVRNPVSFIKDWKKSGGSIVHLTMYGLPITKISEMFQGNDSHKKLLVMIGASKVPIGYYRLADYNLAIGHQPHSEVAALAVFLDRVFNGVELETEFENAKLRIIPQEAGKKILRK